MSYVLYFDGASKGNPGESGCGAVVLKDEKVVAETYHYLGPSTKNNTAEYYALIFGLKMLQEKEFPVEHLVCKGDSFIIIQQMKGEWLVKNKELRKLYVYATLAAEEFENIIFEHVQRESNRKADFLANKAILMKKAFTRTYLENDV